MRADEIRHYRTSYAMGRVLHDMRQAGKRVTSRPPHDPLRRTTDEHRAYSWGFDCGLRGAPCHF